MQQLQRKPRPFLFLGILALGLTGCSRSVVLPRESLEPGQQFGKTRVLTADGFEYQFDRLLVQPDSLRGEYQQEVQRQSAAAGVYYEDIVRAQAVPLERVSSVAVKKADPSRTFFAGVGTAAVVMLFKNLFDSQMQNGGGGGSRTKPDPS